MRSCSAGATVSIALGVVEKQAKEGKLDMPTFSGAHHVALTVQDVDASAAWYQDLFGMQPLMQADDENVAVVSWRTLTAG